MEHYRVDESRKKVKLETHTGTVGIAVSKVYLKLEKKFVQIYPSPKPIDGELSISDTGSVPSITVETNHRLLGKFLRIDTAINFSNIIDENDREKAIANISIEYIISGGPDGIQKFEVLPGEIDDSLKDLFIIIVSKLFQFI